MDRLERSLGEGLGQTAVPGFFMVSSYLFYRDFTWEKLIPKWRSRVKSLLIPYLLWNLLYYIGYVAATRLPGTAHVVGKTPVPFNLEQAAAAVIRYAYNPVFWYLYQLILLVALAPVIYVLCKNTWTGALCLAALMFALWQNRDFPVLNMDAFFYTCAAAYISLHRDSWGRAAEYGWGRRKEMESGAGAGLHIGNCEVFGSSGRAFVWNCAFNCAVQAVGRMRGLGDIRLYEISQGQRMDET